MLSQAKLSLCISSLCLISVRSFLHTGAASALTTGVRSSTSLRMGAETASKVKVDGKTFSAKELADIVGKDENDLPQSFFDKQFDSEDKPQSCGCKASDEPFHVHFGLGRLGCGLVIPALQQKGINFALVQRPSKAWGEVLDEAQKDKHDESAESLSFKVNGKEVNDPLKIIADEAGLGDCGCVGDKSIVALSEDDELLKSLVKRATSFSSSLGPALTKVLPDLLDVLEDKPADERPILYACENEHKPVDELEEQVKEKVHCIKCMVDRICVSRDIESKEHTVNVDAEKFEGRIIVLTPLDDDSIVPFGGDVLVPKEKATAQFFYKRKFSIVNGMHSVLAFLTLRENDADPNDKEEDQKYTLIKPTETEGDLKKEIDAWVGMRCVQLLDEFGVETIAKAVNVDKDDEKAVFDSLLEWGNEALERFSSLDDYTDRIFGGERSNRWCNRVRPLWVFTQEQQFAGSDTPMGRFLEHAKVDESWAKDKIEALSKLGSEMCDQDIKDKFDSTHKCLESNGNGK